MGNNRAKRIVFNCDMCGCTSDDKPSSYNRKLRHFCSRNCYSLFRKNLMPMIEHNSYKGIRKEGESKQIYHKRYCLRNPKKISILKARRYLLEKNANGHHTEEEWLEKKKKYDGKCANCGTKENITKDHIIPYSKGGSNYIENIQPLCAKCNSKKYNNILL